jgi:peptide/nickel transport system substrate-binding protein
MMGKIDRGRPMGGDASGFGRRGFLRGLVAGTIGAAGLPGVALAAGEQKTLVFAVDAITGNSDPGIYATFGDWMAIDCLARGLTHIDYVTTEVKPALAERWDVTDDQRIYTFRLRSGLKFHDSTPVHARDCVRSFSRLMYDNDPTRAPGTYAIAELGGSNVKEVKAVDDLTFRITLADPDVAFLGRLSNPNGVILSSAALDKYGKTIGNNLVGAGPFKFVESTPGQKVVLEAFADYYEGRPPLDRVVLQVLPDPLALTDAVMAGSIGATNFIPHSSVKLFQSNPKFKLLNPKPYIDIFVQMNAGVGVLKDLRVRQAINYALDRKAVVREAFFGRADLPAYLVSPPELGYDDSLKVYSTRDVAKAKKLLQDAGAVGAPVKFINQNLLFWPKIGQIVEQNLREIGLNITASYVDAGTFSKSFFDPNGHELGTWQRSAFVPDPDNKLSPLLAGDSFAAQVGTQNPKLPTQRRLDALLSAARHEVNPGKRGKLYVELQKFLAEEVMVYAMLANIYTPVVSSAELGGLNADALGTYRLFLEHTKYLS